MALGKIHLRKTNTNTQPVAATAAAAKRILSITHFHHELFPDSLCSLSSSTAVCLNYRLSYNKAHKICAYHKTHLKNSRKLVNMSRLLIWLYYFYCWWRWQWYVFWSKGWHYFLLTSFFFLKCIRQLVPSRTGNE